MEDLKNIITESVTKLYGEVALEVKISRPEPQFGDFATNVAMQLAKPLAKNPRQIGEELAEALRQNTDLITEVNLAGPGFINIKVNDSYYQSTINKVLEQGEKFGHNNINQGKLILAEYSDPNPLKPLHAGHLYTTLVGDSMARLLESTGADVKRINYGGDVGLHVGRSMWAIAKAIDTDPAKLDEIPEQERSIWLGQKYVEGTNAYENDEIAKAEIIAVNKKVYDLHECADKETPFAQIYWTVRKWSYDYFEVLYKNLGVMPFDRVIPESEVTPLGLQIVKERTPEVYQESDGAIVFKGEEYGLHTRVFINGQDIPTYEAKEVGLIYTKWKDYKFDQSVIITANEIDQYMQVVLKSIEQFEPELVKRTRHLTHGLVKLAGGVKMSSRKGNILGAVDIIDSARKANKEITGKDDESAVLAAIKYSFLKQRVGGDIIYDPQESVNVLGNSGPYLQYAYVRAKSILAKADENERVVVLPQGDELTLVRKLDEFTDVITQAATELMPHLVTTYLYELAQEFNRFYEKNKVIGSDRQAERLTLLAAYTQVLGNGLDLLGIEKPERM